MLDDSSNRLTWIAVGLASAMLLYNTFGSALPVLASSIMDKMTGAIVSTNNGDVTHTAYAYAADGSDRFSLQKPNLNLIANSTYKTSSNWNYALNISSSNGSGFLNTDNSLIAGKGGSSIYHTLERAPGYSTTGRFQLSEGLGAIHINDTDTLTLSGWVKVNSKYALDSSTDNNISLRLNNYTNFDICKYDFKDQPKDKWIYFSVTDKATPGATALTQVMVSLAGTGSVSTYNLKLELGDKDTSWMPYYSEVQTSDYPTYIGSYTDKNLTDSTDPTKYFWSKTDASLPTQPSSTDPSTTTPPAQTYTHIAYSFSADGTDRFNLTLPQYNIFKGTANAITFAGTGGANGFYTGAQYFIDGNQSLQALTSKDYPDIVVDYDWQVVSGTPTGKFVFQLINNYAKLPQITLSNTNTSGHVYGVQFSAESKGATDPSMIIRTDALPTTTKIKIYNLRAYIKTDKPDFWMPAKSEAKTTDLPGYKGTYTDIIPFASIDPAQYTWTKLN